jgi:hypothetical protein
MKIKISKSRISLLTSGIICLNLLKNKIFKIKIWSLASENTWNFSHNILRFAQQKWQEKKEKKLTFLNHLLALDNVFSTKSEEQEVNLVWPNLFLIFDCPYIFHVFSEARDHILILNILFFNKLRKIIPEVRSEMRDLLIFIFILKTTGTFTLVLVTPRIFLFDIGVR